MEGFQLCCVSSFVIDDIQTDSAFILLSWSYHNILPSVSSTKTAETFADSQAVNELTVSNDALFILIGAEMKNM